LLSDLFKATHEALQTDNCFVTVRWAHESGGRSSRSGGHLLSKELGSIKSLVSTDVVTLGFGDGTRVQVTTSQFDLIGLSRAACGLLAVKKSHLINVGGYNSALKSWGWEDIDVQVRLMRVLRLTHVELGEVRHLSHGDDKRALHGKSKFRNGVANLSMLLRNYSAAQFNGTYENDVAKWKHAVNESL
jgi:hypothetical protein